MKKIIMLIFILPLFLHSEISTLKIQKKTVPDSFKHYRFVPMGGQFSLNDLFIDPQIKIEEQKEPRVGCIKTILFDLQDRKYSLSSDPGPSEDPSFIFSVRDGEKEEQICSIDTDRIYLSAAGYIYSSTGSNNYFQVRRKYLLKGSKITEIKQPFLLVDNQCDINEKTVIKMAPDDKSKTIAALSKGTKVKILLAQYYPEESSIDTEYQWYSVSTPFGLVGWVKTEPGYFGFRPGKPLACIQYSGD